MDGISFKTDMSFAYGVPTDLSPILRRLVANNPSPFTFKGTNTYLVGRRSIAVVDPGPADESHLAAILSAAGNSPITHIFSTHAHRDHVDGIAGLKAATGAKVCAFRRLSRDIIPIEQTPSGTDFVDLELVPDVDLSDGDRMQGEDWALTAIHTPGHAPDHVCFAVDGTDAVLSGDHVMAWNTSVIAPPEGRMSDYIRSLERLLERQDGVFYPGHGAQVADPQRTVKAYLLHRRWREQSIVKAMTEGASTVRDIVPLVYPDIALRMVPAATLTVLAHVEWLAEKGMIEADRPLTDVQPLRVV